MKRLYLLITLLLASIVPIYGCGSADSAPHQETDNAVIIPLSIGDNLPRLELRVTCADSSLSYSYGDAADEHLYTLEVVELREPERANRTLQMFTVPSELDSADEIISVFDINHDDCSDIIVRTHQTAHSAAWYSAYRWLPEKGCFESEPFFDYLCSGQPTLPDRNMMVTSDVTVTSIQWSLYLLDEQGYYRHARTMFCERYDSIFYSVTQYSVDQTNAPQLLYACDYSFDEEIPEEEVMRLNSFFFFGDGHSFADSGIDSAIVTGHGSDFG